MFFVRFDGQYDFCGLNFRPCLDFTILFYWNLCYRCEDVDHRSDVEVLSDANAYTNGDEDVAGSRDAGESN